ncbi:hypothetical protein LX15_000639 [Streptoalloteichus tenebrarius]|uniref:Uncharacterized protein n=1 Tax=Streptoalloteichus tenebrarius (strain ATCC 17920 / DSM 40477 / JCM 4838 / CBS 697.72 / NBRC 16177 / NCIMB 11028 / NRRL B-12390 / A12253. 1 / ISP 5477) TaxID=1933 RepID=A0ABT1HN62_STRSD|nr:hypothetical protein [Streptoalloteichus tenebrarius]
MRALSVRGLPFRWALCRARRAPSLARPACPGLPRPSSPGRASGPALVAALDGSVWVRRRRRRDGGLGDLADLGERRLRGPETSRSGGLEERWPRRGGAPRSASRMSSGPRPLVGPGAGEGAPGPVDRRAQDHPVAVPPTVPVAGPPGLLPSAPERGAGHRWLVAAGRGPGGSRLRGTRESEERGPPSGPRPNDTRAVRPARSLPFTTSADTDVEDQRRPRPSSTNASPRPPRQSGGTENDLTRRARDAVAARRPGQKIPGSTSSRARA